MSKSKRISLGERLLTAGVSISVLGGIAFYVLIAISRVHEKPFLEMIKNWRVLGFIGCAMVFLTSFIYLDRKEGEEK